MLVFCALFTASPPTPHFTCKSRFRNEITRQNRYFTRFLRYFVALRLLQTPHSSAFVTRASPARGFAPDPTNFCKKFDKTSLRGPSRGVFFEKLWGRGCPPPLNPSPIPGVPPGPPILILFQNSAKFFVPLRICVDYGGWWSRSSIDADRRSASIFFKLEGNFTILIKSRVIQGKAVFR